jgi:hypothetical protein
MAGVTRHHHGLCSLAALAALVVAGAASTAAAAPKAPGPEQLIGTWRGTSVCTDRVAAPACKDEVVVYDFTAGARPGEVHWAADKVVNKERGRMGEFDLTYNAAEECWKGEFQSPRVHSVWCLKVEGTRLTGTGRLLPGKEIIREIDARKD